MMQDDSARKKVNHRRATPDVKETPHRKEWLRGISEDPWPFESEQRLRSIIDGSSIPAFVIGIDHRVLYWNKALEELSQIASSEVIGTSQHWRAFYGSERPCMADLLVDGAVKQIPHWYIGKFQKSKLLKEAFEATDFFPELANGGRWLRFTAAVVRDSKGRLVGAIETLEDITERKKAEDSLKESEQKLYSIIQGSPIPAFVIGKDHRVLYWNKALTKLSRIKAADVVGTNRHWRAFYNEQRPCMADLLVDEALGKIQRWYFGKHAPSKLGWDFYEATDFFPALGTHGKWLRFTASPVRNGGGELIGAVETLEDVTERKKAEEALLKAHEKLEMKVKKRTSELAKANRALHKELLERRHAEEALRSANAYNRSLIEASIDPLVTINAEGKIIDANASTERITGHPKEKLIGTEFSRYFTEPDKAREAFRRVFTEGSVHDYELEIRHADDRITPVLYNASLYRNESDGVQGVFAAARDISMRKRQESALREMTDHLSLILESLPIVSFTCNTDRNFEITFVSNTIEEVTGYLPRQFLQDRLFWQSHIHPDDRQKVISDLRSGIKKMMHRCGYRFRIADGSYKWLSDYRKVIETPDGNINIVGAWQDVTEEKKIRQEAELRLQQMIQTHKLTALGEVVAGVAHEINNPISFIGYNIPLLEEIWKAVAPALADSERSFNAGFTYTEIAQNMQEIIYAFKSGSSRITRVISGLREFARSDESAPKKPINISDVIQGALLIVGSQVRKTVSSIDIRIEDDLPQIQGHFQKIEQVMTNLLINAHQAIPAERKGRISIAARYIPRLKMVLVEIEDNGTGMDKNVLSHLFDPFFTTRRERGGTGLGLSISYGLIKEHNGLIGVLSRPGYGSRFTLFLPLDGKKKIALYPAMLCIDSDAAFLKELKTNFFDAVDWPLESHDREEDVIRHLEDHPEIDILISEIRLPKIDGWELLKKVKERFPLLPAILYTGDASVLEGSDKRKVQPDKLLYKPFQIENLQNIIREIGRQRL